MVNTFQKMKQKYQPKVYAMYMTAQMFGWTLYSASIILMGIELATHAAAPWIV